MSDKKDCGDPFLGDEEGFPDDIDLGDLDTLEILDCWEEDEGAEIEEPQEATSSVPEKLIGTKVVENISTGVEKKNSVTNEEKSKPAIRANKVVTDDSKVAEPVPPIRLKNSSVSVDQNVGKSEELPKKEKKSDSSKGSGSEKGYGLDQNVNVVSSKTVKITDKEAKACQVTSVKSGTVQVKTNEISDVEKSSLQSIERVKHPKLVINLLKDKSGKGNGNTPVAKPLQDPNGKTNQQDIILDSAQSSSVKIVGNKKETKEIIEDSLKGKHHVKDIHQSSIAEVLPVSKSNSVSHNTKTVVSTMKKAVDEHPKQPFVNSSRSGGKDAATSKKAHGNSSSSQVSKTTSMETEVERFLHEMASNHPISDSINDVKGPLPKRDIMDLPDGPPGVDLDELNGDISMDRRNNEEKFRKTTPLPADSTTTRIDGRLYADYAQIFGEDESKDKGFSISPESDRHFSRPLGTERRRERSNSPFFTEGVVGRYLSPHPTAKVLWNSPPRRSWSNYRSRETDDEALRALSRSLSRERQLPPKSGAHSRRSHSRSRSPRRLSRLSPRTTRSPLLLSPRPSRSPRRVSPRPTRSPVRVSRRATRSPLRVSPRPARSPLRVSPLRVSPRPSRSPFRTSPRGTRLSPKPRERRLSVPRPRSPTDQRLKRRGMSRSRTRSPRRSLSKPRVVPRPKHRSTSRSRSPVRVKSRSRSRTRVRNHSPVRPPSRGRYVSPPGSRPRGRLPRRSRSVSRGRGRSASRSPSWTGDKGRKRVLSPDRNPRVSPVRTKKSALYRSVSPGPSWLPSGKAPYSSLVPVPMAPASVQLEQDMERFIATNMAVTGQTNLFLAATVTSPAVPTPVPPPVPVPSVTAPAPAYCPAPYAAPLPVPVPVPVPAPVPAPTPSVNMLFQADTVPRGCTPPPAPPPPSIDRYYNKQPDGLSIRPGALAPTINRGSAQDTESSRISLSSFLEAAVKGSAPTSVRVESVRPVARYDPTILTRCREAIIALSDLSSYGRFVFSPSRAGVLPSRNQDPNQLDGILLLSSTSKWESPILRAVKARIHLPFTTPPVTQKEEITQAEQSEQESILAQKYQEVLPQEEKSQQVGREEKAIIREPESPSEVEELRRKLDAALVENKNLMRKLAARYSVLKSDAAVQTSEDVVCSLCRMRVPVVSCSGCKEGALAAGSDPVSVSGGAVVQIAFRAAGGIETSLRVS